MSDDSNAAVDLEALRLTTANIDRDLECARCCYNLRTQPIAGRCPECGLAVGRSLPPPGFRFRKMATVFRVRRGLALLAVGIMIQVLAAVALFVVLRWYYKLPATIFAVGFRSCFWAQYASLIVTTLGLVLITYPFGWRGDRFLPCLGIGVAVLTVLFVAESIAEYLWPHAGSWPFGLSWNAFLAVSAPFWYCLSMAYVLVWVNLFARVRAAEHKGLWAVALLVLLTQVFLLTQGVGRYVCFIAGTTEDPGPSGVVSWGYPDDWLGGWERQINGVAWIVTLIGVWFYLRELNRLVAGRSEAPTK
jgi:hypothetical protein